jgi:hypothetical protein
MKPMFNNYVNIMFLFDSSKVKKYKLITPEVPSERETLITLQNVALIIVINVNTLNCFIYLLDSKTAITEDH